MAIKPKKAEEPLTRAGGYVGQGKEIVQASARARISDRESTGADQSATETVGQESELEVAEAAAADAGKWSEGVRQPKKYKQAKAYGVRLPGLEQDFRNLQTLVAEELAVDTARLVLVGSVAGLVALSETDPAGAENAVRAEMSRRNRRKRERKAGDEPDYMAHLFSVRLGIVERDFAALKLLLEERADDLDTSNQVVIAAAMAMYLPVSADRTAELTNWIRKVVSRERAAEIQKKVAAGA